LIKNPNNTVKNCNRIDKYNHHPIRQCNQAKFSQLDFYVGGVCAHGSWVWRCGIGFATDAIGRRIAGLLVASDWAAFVNTHQNKPQYKQSITQILPCHMTHKHCHYECIGFATDAIGRRIAGLLVASDWAAFVVFFIAEFVKIKTYTHHNY
jgi:hypothetical protein